MKRPFQIFLLLVVSGLSAFGQGKDNSLKGVPFKERIVTGGGLGLGFGSVQDFISVSPVLGYSLTKKFIAGTGITYRYTNYKYYNPSLKLTDYAVSPFLRYNIYRGIFAQTEYEYLNYEFPVTERKPSAWALKVFLPGVASCSLSGRTSLSTSWRSITFLTSSLSQAEFLHTEVLL
jgi:hypothetical protein